MTNEPLSSDTSHSELYLKMTLDVFQEHLRQARQTFNLSVVALIVSISISAIGAGLLIGGKATEGTVTAATGLLSTTFCTQIAKESSEKLEELTENLKTLHPSSKV
ncbi:hypothetical protein [Fischerella sp.]|jgi:predicted Co/Zn/Cd cation transporter (cation efflux family)|uniref:TRADD-N-associated membrane domain-containing protein n=1 Tax=Fischerella sp. TaxID=1191 RepID=UPI0025BFABB4|nr:hypothetical protein [Fischerella sp.]